MSHFRVRVQVGDFDIEVDSSERDYTESKLKELMKMVGAPKDTPEPRRALAAPKPLPPGAKPTSIVEYVRSLAPKSGTQYVVAVGDYLERHGGMLDGFRTRDIVEGFRTVKYKHANPAEAVRSAKQQGFLMDGKEAGSMVVTQTGESWVKGQLAEETG